MPQPDVVVIGAGFAGLSAAVRLAERGARVLVVEERRRLGGRATAFPDPQSGEFVDNGQHVLFGCYHETFAFLRAVGAEDAVALDTRLDLEIIDRAGERSRLRSVPLPAPFHLVGALLRWDALGVRDRLAALRLGLVLRRLHRRLGAARADGDRTAHMTVDEWLAAHGQTPRLHEVLWEPLAVAALNQSPAVASAAPFVEVLTRMFGGGSRDAAIGLPRRPLDELYAEPARRALERDGHAIRCGLPARLAVEHDRAIGVDVREERISAGAVISSVPWFAFPAVAGHVPALVPIVNAAARMDSSPIVTVNLWLDRPLATAPFVGLPGRRFHWMFDKAQLFGEQASHVSLVSSGAGELVGLGNDALVEIARTELAAAFPAPWSVVRATAVREKRATFSLAPGQPRRPPAETPVRNFLLAGDWTDTGLPATIESAVLSGHRAAAAVVLGA
jgi:squalene-associated FAD-dependent desaturase